MEAFNDQIGVNWTFAAQAGTGGFGFLLNDSDQVLPFQRLSGKVDPHLMSCVLLYFIETEDKTPCVLCL